MLRYRKGVTVEMFNEVTFGYKVRYDKLPVIVREVDEEEANKVVFNLLGVTTVDGFTYPDCTSTFHYYSEDFEELFEKVPEALQIQVNLDKWNEELYVAQADKHLPTSCIYNGSFVYDGLQHRVFMIYAVGPNKMLTLSHDQFTVLFKEVL